MSPPTFLDRSRYYLANEYPTKVRLAVEGLSRDVIWWRPNEESNSIGNLIVHLAGNIRQWIVGGVGDIAVERDRAAEFSVRNGRDVAELLSLLDLAVRDSDAVLARLTPHDLNREVMIQGRNTTVLSAVYHVVEHFSMHTGQILVIAKMHSPGSVKFYEDAGGLARPLWEGSEGVTKGGAC